MKRLSLITLFLFVLCAPSYAHDYWIIPDTFHPQESSLLNTTFGCGHAYFASEEVPDITKFMIVMLTPEGRLLPVAPSRLDSKAATLTVPILGAGTYVIGSASIMPSYWSSTKEGWVAQPRSRVKGVLKGGKYFKSLKTFLTVGSPSNSYKKVFGFKIELVPQKNPTTLKLGEELPVVAFYNDQPLAGANVFGIFEGYNSKKHDFFPIEVKTDKNGVARISMDRPGTWLLGVKYQFKTPNDPDADYENDRAYIMFNIKKNGQ